MGRAAPAVVDQHPVAHHQRIVAGWKHPHVVPRAVGPAVQPRGPIDTFPMVAIPAHDQLGVQPLEQPVVELQIAHIAVAGRDRIHAVALGLRQVRVVRLEQLLAALPAL